MNYRVVLVFCLGLLMLGMLLIYPPWLAHGEYVGHFRVDRVAWMELDESRLYLEMAVVVLAITFFVVRMWGKRN